VSKKKIKIISRKNALFLLAFIFVIAFAVRITNLEIIKNNPFFNSPTMDEKYHDDWARDIARGQLFGNAPFYRAPAYPFFLGLIYAIFGKRY
jgi:hypothetical protein